MKRNELKAALAPAKTIKADRKQLKKNICSQFSDYRLWIREYIVNAKDASARSVTISGQQTDEIITIQVRDDGHGMDRGTVEAFTEKGRSIKQCLDTAVGRFGFGSYSVAAIPGQCGFGMVTSTGTETWRLQTGGLLSDDPFSIERILPEEKHGTTFEISYERMNMTLVGELRKAEAIIRKYLAHFPIDIYIEYPQDAEEPHPGNCLISCSDWDCALAERFPMRKTIFNGGTTFDVVLAMGTARHQLYQRRVLITQDDRSHDPLNHGAETDHRICMPHLSIRVDSLDFELPIGRHSLCNPEILDGLSRQIRQMLRDYMERVADMYASNHACEFEVSSYVIEEMLIAWLDFFPIKTSRFHQIPLFWTYDNLRLSFLDLQNAVALHGSLYIEDPDSVGMDYTVFDAPVLRAKQPGNAQSLLAKWFKGKTVNLCIENLVQEAPAKVRNELTADERKLEHMLGFHREVLAQYRGNTSRTTPQMPELPPLPEHIKKQLCEESKSAMTDLENLDWKVEHLVGRNGKSPNDNVLFLCTENRITLNLNHPEIRDLVTLAKKAPALAGHYALALCMTSAGHNSALEHLSPMAREELINLDAICRCGSPEAPPCPNTG